MSLTYSPPATRTRWNCGRTHRSPWSSMSRCGSRCTRRSGGTGRPDMRRYEAGPARGRAAVQLPDRRRPADPGHPWHLRRRLSSPAATAPREVDIAFRDDPDGLTANLVDGAIGEPSPFDEQFGATPKTGVQQPQPSTDGHATRCTSPCPQPNAISRPPSSTEWPMRPAGW